MDIQILNISAKLASLAPQISSLHLLSLQSDIETLRSASRAQNSLISNLKSERDYLISKTVDTSTDRTDLGNSMSFLWRETQPQVDDRSMKEVVRNNNIVKERLNRMLEIVTTKGEKTSDKFSVDLVAENFHLKQQLEEQTRLITILRDKLKRITVKIMKSQPQLNPSISLKSVSFSTHTIYDSDYESDYSEDNRLPEKVQTDRPRIMIDREINTLQSSAINQKPSLKEAPQTERDNRLLRIENKEIKEELHFLREQLINFESSNSNKEGSLKSKWRRMEQFIDYFSIVGEYKNRLHTNLLQSYFNLTSSSSKNPKYPDLVKRLKSLIKDCQGWDGENQLSQHVTEILCFCGDYSERVKNNVTAMKSILEEVRHIC